MNRADASRPARVAAMPKQAGEPHGRRDAPKWEWVETAVWTSRMLAALEQGVRGGRWYALMDKVEAERTLRHAFYGVWRNDGSAGVDGQSVRSFDAREDEELAKLSAQLRSGTYRALAVKRVWIPKPGSEEKRPLGIPAVRDRVVQGALKAVIEPIFEQEFAPQSYGFRPGRSCKDALRRVEELLQDGCTHVVDADLKSYFDTIPHERMMERVREKIADGRVLKLIESFLKAGVLDGLKEWTPESGTPQGGVISPLLANLYLNPLDQLMVQRGWQMVRYADDFVVLCRSEAEARAALEEIKGWVEAEGLSLHPQKTRIVDARGPGGFDFLGYHFERGQRWPRRKSMDKLRDKIRELTPRLSGESLERIVARLNQSLRGWFGYFKHSNAIALRQVDQFVRGRVRTILRRRDGRRGPARGEDHHRYPNTYFDDLGLFNLTRARRSQCQSHA